MTSIHTNAGAISALQTLRTINANMLETQSRVSSGLRVRTAENNAAYWAVATTMRSDNMALDAVSDALGVSDGIVNTAYAGMSSAIEVMHQVKAKLVAAHEAGVDKTKINTELDQLKDQLRSIASSASFAGQNWLHMTDPTDPLQNGVKSLPASFVRDPSGSVSISSIKFDMTAVFDTDQVFYLVSDGGCDGIITNSGFATMQGYSQDWVLISGENHGGHPEITLTDETTREELAEMTVVVDLMTERMIKVASMFGALSERISSSSAFVEKLTDSIETGIGRLVDADMDQESTRLKALETQQQLGLQSLQIANTSAEGIMTLFR
ncbi:flagellin [Shinella kummerowiae]|uniref:flagellin N-terminal helical domain-containing protein n=1 Tax=Shinella kummerowiae TaxID=417745 RepID=UPI0021B6A82A|nr:flagellin [Shinella kummerowiae]MCT7665431.1 flagellin [Shinella kummerowiae]